MAIPHRDVAMDTSAASRLVDDTLVDRVAAAASAFDARIVVPLVVVAELIDCADKGRVRARLEALGELQHLAGEARFGVGADIHSIVSQELAGELLGGVPLAPPEQVAPMVRIAAEGADVPGLSEFLAKDRTHTLDRGTRAALFDFIDRRHATEHPGAPALTDSERRNRARADLREAMADFRLHALGPDAFGLEFAVSGEPERERVRSAPERFPACAVLAGAAQLQAMTSAFADVGYGQWAGILRAPLRNDWVDLRVLVSAARATLLLTDDDGQRKRADFLGQAFGAPMRARELERWLER